MTSTPLSLAHGLRGLIFDLDGVVVDSEPLHEEAERRVFEALGLTLTPAHFREIKGMVTREAIAHLLRRCAGETHDVDAVVARKERLFHDLLAGVQPVPGALTFLRRMAPRFERLGLTTSSVPATQRFVFDRFGLHPYFHAVVTAADVTRPKPDPEPYRLTAQRLGLPPEACLVIEDSVNGVRSAAAAGCRVAGLTTSFDAAALREAGAHVIVAGFDELERLLTATPPA